MSRQESLFLHLGRLRQGYTRGRGSLLVLATFSVVFSALILAALSDLALRYSGIWCWLVWLVLVGLISAGVYFVGKTFKEKVSDESMAVLVEKTNPNLDNHLINAVQLANGVPDSGTFVDALLGEVDADLDHVQSEQLYSRRSLKWCLWALGGSALVALVMTICAPRGTAHSVGRMLFPMAGIKPYTLTHIASVTPGDTKVLRGHPLDIVAEFGGTLPEKALVVWDRGKGKVEEIAFGSAGEKGKSSSDLAHQTAHLKAVFHESKYRVVAGDTKSRWYTVAVTNPPGLENWKAKIKPPKHVGGDSYWLDTESEDLGIPVGSDIMLGGHASCELSMIAILQDERLLAEKGLAGETKFGAKFRIRDGGAVRVKLTGMNGLEAMTTLPFAALPDRKPSLVLVDTRQRMMVARDAQVPITFRVEDDYGVLSVGLQRAVGEDEYEPVSYTRVPGKKKVFAGRFLVDIPSFGVRSGDTLRFRLWAEDNGLEAERRRGYSPVVQLTIPVPEEEKAARKKGVNQTKDSILALIKMQRENLRNTRPLADQALLGKEISMPRVQAVQTVQKSVRDTTGGLLGNRAALGEFATVLSGLINHEMTEVLEAFEECHRLTKKTLPAGLARCVRLETRILATLTGIPMGMNNEQQHQEKTDLFAALQKLVASQRDNLKDSKLAQQKDAQQSILQALAEVEDGIANDLVVFTDKCLIMIEERVDDDFAKQLRKVHDTLNEAETYEKLLNAAEALEEGDMAAGIQSEEEALKALMQALNILNQWRMKNAQRVVKEASEVLKKTKDTLEKLLAKQAKIAEVTRDLTSRGALSEEEREKLREMDEEQKDMAKLVEELANDLYQFPELPVCGELNSKMREIFEDVEQAMESENAPAKEIAVQKEDALLDLIRKTKERVEDVEMWLPDIPDNIVWNMESFDTDEFPDIPLVPLPDELEDIVGELLDQASDVDAQSQDTTGNNIIADMEMGWGVMDGPMPCFSAKGKSGNTRPNDNEMTGRSGAGREGQSNGELVENHVKGLEGRKTHARRTQDPFQKGMVTEDENSTMDARSTGGGKLGGESETIGMFGKSARRDLHTADHGNAPMKLRQETEAIYATARLLYLGTGSLGNAARELRGVETAQKRMKSFGSLHRRVLRRLEDTQVELNSGVVLPMPVITVSKAGGAVTDDVDISKISEEYRDIVSDYYRSLEKK
ncbi:MAG: hypothetical protein KAI66_06390 [Lentisphaeria bacterium]|nr:hypothetical protein [Lentisphaeria bacterium]